MGLNALVSENFTPNFRLPIQALPRAAIKRLYLPVLPDASNGGLEGDMQRKKVRGGRAVARSLRGYDRRGVTRDSLNSVLWARAG